MPGAKSHWPSSHVLARAAFSRASGCSSFLDRLRERPVVWVSAQPGAGKTTLLTSYLDSRKVKSLWYQLDPGDADCASFF
jgi:ATP/maltotriose-dependent transcriptional regulator MalT